MDDDSPYNGVSSIQAELPKLTLRDAAEQNSVSSISSPPPGPLSPNQDLIGSDIGDMDEVPINDNNDITPRSVFQSQSLEEVI